MFRSYASRRFFFERSDDERGGECDDDGAPACDEDDPAPRGLVGPPSKALESDFLVGDPFFFFFLFAAAAAAAAAL